MAWVVAPVLHVYFTAVDDVNVTGVPGHNVVVVEGDIVILGAEGKLFIVIETEADLPEQPKASVAVT